MTCDICETSSVLSVLSTTLVVNRPIMGTIVPHDIGDLNLCEECFVALLAVQDVAQMLGPAIPFRRPNGGKP